MKKIKVTVIGGGTGTMPVLRGLKLLPELDISVIVGMSDDGGSNAIVRDEFGLLPLSDLRKSIIALAGGENFLLQKLFTHRFAKGAGLEGHTLGNLIMMALSDITGSEENAIETTSKLFDLQGHVIPVTLEKGRLTAQYEDGTIIQGEHLIDEPEEDRGFKITKLFISPEVHANPRAIQAIKEADYTIIGPGDLYTSTLANIVVQGIPNALQNTNAKIIFITNLMTKKGQTHGMKTSNFVNIISKYIKREPDYTLINNAPVPKKIKEKYKKKNEYQIKDDLKDKKTTFVKIYDDLINDFESKKENGDKLERSLLRHNPDKLKNVLKKIMKI